MADQQNADIVYNAQLDAFTLYHIVQEEAGKSSSLSGGPVLPALGHAIAGSAATAATKLLLYPLDLVITRLQVQKQLSGPKEAPSAAKDGDAEYDNLVDAARKIYDAEGGLKAFYTGLAPDVVKGLGDSFLFFLVYNYLRQRETKKFSNTLPVSRELGIGIAAGAFSRFVTTPLQNIITRQQTAALIAARDPTSTTTPAQSGGLSVKDVALQIRSERGLKGFWAGYSASVVLTLNPAITFAIDNFLHRLMPKARRDDPSPQLTFLIAATSKAIATAITYPVSLAKSRAQVSTPAAPQDTHTMAEKDSDSDDAHIVSPPSHTTTPNSIPLRRKATSTLHRLLRLLSAQYAILLSLRKIHRAEGWRGLYSGLEAEVLKGFLSHGLTMMMKDRVHVGVIQLYYVLLKVTRRWPQEVREVRDEAVRKVGGVRERVEGEVERVGEGVREGVEGVVQEGKRVVWGEKKEGE